MDAATHPGAGQAYARVLFSYADHDNKDSQIEDIEELSATAMLVYGIQPTLAALVEVEFARFSMGDAEESGLVQSSFRLKQRLFKYDYGPLDTWMASVMAGITVPGETGRMASLDPFPRIALVSTAIFGRHGVNGGIEWEEYGSDSDRYSFNGSYLYRLSPAQYLDDTGGAWYWMLESLNEATREGDYRADLSTGILYEAWSWACELSLRVPLKGDWMENKEDFRVTFGLRYLP